MIQTGGLAILFAWLIFAALLAVLTALLLRRPADVMAESRRRLDGPGADGSDAPADPSPDQPARNADDAQARSQ